MAKTPHRNGRLTTVTIKPAIDDAVCAYHAALTASAPHRTVSRNEVINELLALGLKAMRDSEAKP